MPTISVITPCYNREKFIGQAVESVLAQTFPDFELIIVDDGSVDNSRDVVRKYVDDRVQLIVQENRGPSEARNAGLRSSRGKWVKFLDSDDLMEPDCLRQQMENIGVSPPNSVVLGTAASLDEVGNVLRIEKYNILGSRAGAEVKLRVLVSGCGNGQFYIFPRTASVDVGGFNPNVTVYEDCDLIFLIFEHGYRFFLFDTPVVRVRSP